jgi:hypothetical protein
MYSSFEVLAVASETRLRDPGRIRGLFRHYFFGTLVASAAFTATGLGLLVAWLWLLSSPAIHDRTQLLWLSGLSAFMMLAVAFAFRREAWGSPLAGYPRRPGEYSFARGRIDSALPVHSERFSKILVRGSFGSGGLFLAHFDARLWQEGREPGLPMDAWVLFAHDKPRVGVLVGLPAKGA